MRVLITKFLLFLFGLFFVWNCAYQVNARAGGGSSSRSSSSSSHSSSFSNYGSSSSFGSNGLGYSSTGNSGSGIIVIVIIIIIVGYVILGPKSEKGFVSINSQSGDDSSTEPVIPTPVNNLTEKITAIKAIDPGFNEQMFEDRVSTAFFKIQNAWCNRDMNQARAFITDSVLGRFNMQLEEYRQNKTRNKLEGLSLGNVQILDISLDAIIEQIDVHVTATAKDYIIDEAGKYISGDKNRFVTWDEKWGFVRTAGVKTDAEKSVFSEKCPNCGAPLKVDTTGECEYCRSNITTGKFDWVLSEITQLNT